MNHSSLTGLAPSLLSLALAAAAAAQTPITGYLSGTLTAGVYVASGGIGVAAGQTLVLGPGVIIKANGPIYFQVDGALVCNGTQASPVIFTSYSDDSAGGDTNGNGPSSGNPAQWYGLGLIGAGSTLAYTEVRYAGYGSYPGIGVSSSSPTLSHCTVRDGYANGLQTDHVTRPNVTNCTFIGNGGTAIYNLHIDAVAGFAGNTASGNGRNVIAVTNGTATTTVLGPQSMVSGAIVFDVGITVNGGSSLTIAAGTVIKVPGPMFHQFAGALVCNGTAANPVIFTSYTDDSAGGDTNGNGPSGGQMAQWYGLDLTGSASTLAYTEVRYAGYGGYPGIGVHGSAPTLTHCTVRDGYAHGLQTDHTARPHVTACSFSGNGGTAIHDLHIDAVAGFANNTASGNGRDILAVTNASATTTVLGPQSMVNGAIVFDVGLLVAAGSSLQIAAGTVIKANGPLYDQVSGTLVCNGTAANPVIFTSFSDDSAGGNTNGGGVSTGNPAQWYGMVLNGAAANASTLTWTEVRFTGYGAYPGIAVNSCDPALSHCTVRSGYANGLQLDGAARPTVTACAFDGNGGSAVEAASLHCLPGFAHNTATGNARSYLRVTNATVTTPVVVGPSAHINGAIVLTVGFDVQATGALDVLQGTVFKSEGPLYHQFSGPTHLRGTGYEPVVFTSIGDDAYGGDTNGNGPSAGAQAQWYGLRFHGTGASTSLENVIVRCAGYGTYPAVSCANTAADLKAVRTENSYADGFELAAATRAQNLVAFSCGSSGIHLTGGAFDVVHATCAANGTGMRAEAGWTGTVVNSIARQNGTNLLNFTAGRFLRSDGGFAGQNGCIDQDPQFVGLANGDLRLSATSPCLDVADYATAIGVQKDFLEYPRVLDHALVGLALPDMGAHERAPWHMEVFGDTTLGSTVFLTMQGPAGDSFVGFGLMDGTAMLQPYGEVLAGMPGGALAILFPFPVAVGTPIPLAVPNSTGVVGTILGLQTLNLQQGNWSHGAFAELFRVNVRP